MNLLLEVIGKYAFGAGSTTAALALGWWFTNWQARKALDGGDLTNEVLIVSNIIEDVEGVPFLKPRTVRYERPIEIYFPNAALAKAIVVATERAEADVPETQLVRLADDQSQGRLMKRVVNIASELGAPGHILRMFGKLFDKNDAYVCINYAQAGEDDWIIRIDTISAIDLKRFLDPEFVKSLSYRSEEGSHADNAAILAFCAQQQFGGKNGSPMPDARKYVRRVSIPTLKSLSLDEVLGMIVRDRA